MQSVGPGPVTNLQLTSPSSSELHATWNPPDQSGTGTVIYSIFIQLIKLDNCLTSSTPDFERKFHDGTSNTQMTIGDLLPYSEYEVWVRPRSGGENGEEVSRRNVTRGGGKSLCLFVYQKLY